MASTHVDATISVIVGELAKLDLKPGDQLVLHCDQMLKNDEREHLQASLEERFPGHKAIVLGKGMRLGILQQPDSSVKFREFLG